ncbi:hypothetical protein B0J11DRAFT_528994 [Dendryphion nanum]|uniref:Shugoshin n=1 Tax=Dendryphion nanum TaxID=256645 RepID=A0A9P9DV85_9PLEO|nr:hypothetical protein B0J11DRAFT_528994 [Dendryphion nanum]
MARLNEPPAAAPGPPVETVDAVRRRFLRQNRELAKINSQQSIRIRNLETEGSRLLAENLSLREQVLQLQNVESNRPSFEMIDLVRDRLNAKMQELGSLVAELGQLKKGGTKQRRKSQATAKRRSQEERQWRSGLCLQEVENAMMPTIVEDKYYPRHTMNADEIQDMMEDQDSQSPDIGPPPVSRFGDEESIPFNSSPQADEPADEAPDGHDAALSINLETRRKRRESGPKLNIRRVSVFESSPEGEDKPKPVRIGAKRKFNVQEDVEKTVLESDTFTYSRKNAPIQTSAEEGNEEEQPRSTERPVLGSKPVNTDPVLSPKKQRSSTTDKPEKPDKKSLIAPKMGRSRLTITRAVPTELPPLHLPPPPIQEAEIHLESHPPKTPALEDIFSAPSTEPSTSRQESTDTPPPGSFNSDDQSAFGARPSRRARAQVSYKEPGLGGKLRRPGGLVDAVQPQPDRRTSTEPTPLGTGASSIKCEAKDSDSAWKSLSIVGRIGNEDGEIGSPLREKLDRKIGSRSNDLAFAPEEPNGNSSTATPAIPTSILGATASKRKSSNSQLPSEGSSAYRLIPGLNITSKPISVNPTDKDSLAVFDFTDSSPVDGNASSRPRIDLAKAARASRRHSSVPASSIPEERRAAELKSRTEKLLPASSHSRTGSGSVTSSTKSVLMTKTTSTGRLGTKEKKSVTLPSSGSGGDLKAAGDDGGASSLMTTAGLRAERAASRRKSMMV